MTSGEPEWPFLGGILDNKYLRSYISHGPEASDEEKEPTGQEKIFKGR
jgi:hypothetical protein